jgi:hypothetical protein
MNLCQRQDGQTMKRNLLRRIEALEIERSAAANDRKAIAERALNSLFRTENVQFLSAFGAEHVGRELTEADSRLSRSI